MKITTVIDPTREEEIVIYLNRECDIPEQINTLLHSPKEELFGYKDGQIIRLLPRDIICVTVEGGRVYALTEREKLFLKMRLYEAEAMLGEAFVKINQSCIVRIDAIESFDTSLGGALRVKLKNGFRDYVSRRQMKTVKRRMGIGK